MKSVADARARETRRRSSGCWSGAARRRRSLGRGPRHRLGRRGQRRPRADRLTSLDRRPPGAADLHQRQHRAAEGRRAHPRRHARQRRQGRRLPRRHRRRATVSAGSPTSAGSWAPGRSSPPGSLGAQLCLIEGSPTAPLTRLFESVQRSRTTVLGIGPSLVRALMSAGETTCDPLRPQLAAGARHRRRAGAAGRLRVDAERDRRRRVPDRQPVRRHRGRRLLFDPAAQRRAEGLDARGSGARHGHRGLRSRTARRWARTRSASWSAEASGPG